MSDLIDALIVGAGPVGLTLAQALSRYQLTCRIIDKKPNPTQTSNALGVSPRTMEIWQSLGLINDALAQGLPISQARYYLNEHESCTLSFKDLPSLYPFILGLPQANTEQIYLQHLAQKHIQVERDTVFVAAEDKDDYSEVQLQKTNGEIEIVRTKWLVGCDGYHSATRAQAHISYEGQDLPQHFFMMDAAINSTDELQEARLVMHAKGIVLFIPTKKFVRIVVEVSQDERWQEIKEPTLEMMQSIIKERVPFPLKVESALWLSAFWVHERVANCYRKGRLLLAGDAAHAHSPAGGQGMNTGIQDAFNLAWKLALVCQNKALESLLDSYQAERRPIAQRVVSESGHLTQVATTNSGWRKIVRNFLFKHALSFSFIRKKITTNMSQLDIFYPPHQVRSTVYSEQGKFVLFIIGQVEATAAVNWVEQNADNWIEIRNIADISSLHSSHIKNGFCLIRPDMYVGIESEEFSVVQSYLDNIFIKHNY